MEALKKERKVLEHWVTFKIEEIDKLNISDPVLLDESKLNIDFLNDKCNRLSEVSDKISSELWNDSKLTDEDLLKEFSNNEECRKTVQRAKNKIQKITEAIQDTLSKKPISTSKVEATKLPRIETLFDGKVINWPTFWTSFKKIYEDKEISDKDKYDYLLQNIDPNSKLYGTVNRQYQETGSYGKAIKHLLSIFIEDFKLDYNIKKFYDVIFSQVTDKMTKFSFIDFYPKLETRLKALDTAKLIDDKTSRFLVLLIEKVLPEEAIEMWQKIKSKSKQESTSEKKDSKILKSLMGFIEFQAKKEKLDRERLCSNDGETRKNNIPAPFKNIKAEENAAILLSDKDRKSENSSDFSESAPSTSTGGYTYNFGNGNASNARQPSAINSNKQHRVPTSRFPKINVAAVRPSKSKQVDVSSQLECDTIEKFNVLNVFLSRQDNLKMAWKTLAEIEAKDPYSFVTKCLNKIFKNDLGKKFTWQGINMESKYLPGFRDRKIRKAILEAVNYKYKGAFDQNRVENRMKNFFGSARRKKGGEIKKTFISDSTAGENIYMPYLRDGGQTWC